MVEAMRKNNRALIFMTQYIFVLGLIKNKELKTVQSCAQLFSLRTRIVIVLSIYLFRQNGQIVICSPSFSVCKINGGGRRLSIKRKQLQRRIAVYSVEMRWKPPVQLDQEESKRMNKIQPSDAKKNCLSQLCKREMLLRSRFLNSDRATLAAAAKIKPLSAAEGDQAAQVRKLQPQMTVDGEPCLRNDCRTRKRSMKERLNARNTALMEKLKLPLGN